MPSRLIARASASPDKPPCFPVSELEIEAVAELPDALVCRPGGNLGAERVVAMNEAIVAALGEKSTVLLFDLARTEDLDPAGVGFSCSLAEALERAVGRSDPSRHEAETASGNGNPGIRGIFLLFPGSAPCG